MEPVCLQPFIIISYYLLLLYCLPTYPKLLAGITKKYLPTACALQENGQYTPCIVLLSMEGQNLLDKLFAKCPELGKSLDFGASQIVKKMVQHRSIQPTGSYMH